MKEKNNKFFSKGKKSVSFKINKNVTQTTKNKEIEDKKFVQKNIKSNNISPINISEKKEKGNESKKNSLFKKKEISETKSKDKSKMKEKSKPMPIKNNTKEKIKENIKSTSKDTKNNNTKEKKIENSTKKSKNLKTKSKKTKDNLISTRVKSKNFSIDKFFSTASKNKETLSTYQDTLSTEENNKKEKEEETLINKMEKNEIKNLKENKNENEKIRGDIKKKTLKNSSKNFDLPLESIETIKKKDHEIPSELTPIPILKNTKNGEQIDRNSKDVQKAIILRRLEYNDYIKNLNKPKPKKPKPKPKPKPKVYDNNKVNEIQKMYRGFQIRKVNQIINRLKVNLCVTELTCLIFKEVFIHARRRITFNILKLYYHEPFSNIDDEVNFNDKLSMKLSDIYYNFNNFTKQRVRMRRKIKHINKI